MHTFETLLHQELGKLQGKDELCKSIQRILERVLKVSPAGLAPLRRRPKVTFLAVVLSGKKVLCY